MKVGKISETVLKRSVFKQIRHRREEVLVTPGVGKDCSIIRLEPDEVMVLSTGTLSLDESWTADASLSAQRFRAVDEENEGYGAYDELYAAYTKTVVVDGEPASVELSGLDSSCLVAVKFIYDEICGEEIKAEEPRVTNIRYYGPTNDGTKVAENTQPQYGTDFKNGSLLYTNYALTCSDV